MTQQLNRRPPRSGLGFTLIEVLVALAIIATALVAVFRLFSQTVDAEMASRFYTTAPLLANAKMAEAKSGIVAARGNAAGSFENFPGYEWRLDVKEMAANPLGEATDDLKQIDVTVSAGEQRKQAYHLRSYEFLR
jgi:general secretion pathway protein I